MEGEEFKDGIIHFHPTEIIRQIYIIIYVQDVAPFEIENKNTMSNRRALSKQN